MTSIDKSQMFNLAWKRTKAAIEQGAIQANKMREFFAARLVEAWAIAKRGAMELSFELFVTPLYCNPKTISDAFVLKGWKTTETQKAVNFEVELADGSLAGVWVPKSQIIDAEKCIIKKWIAERKFEELGQEIAGRWINTTPIGRWNGSAYQIGRIGSSTKSYFSQGSYGGGMYRE